MRVMNPCWYIVNNKKNACFLKCYLYLMHLRKGLLILFLSFSRVATLTIKGYEKRGKLYHLCFPNLEVRQGFSDSLVR